MNWVDLVIVAAVAAAVYSGYRRGALMQAFSWGGFVVGLVLGATVGPRIAGLFDSQSALARATIGLAAFLGIAFLVEGLTAFAGMRLRRRITHSLVNKFDAVFGSLIGAFLSLLAAWVLGFTLARGPSPELARAIRGSAILRAADRIAPHPPNFLAEIGRFLDRTGFPEVFARLNPSLAPGVEAPPAALARDPKIIAAAELTFKIESSGCGGLVDGSGFPVRDHFVITAAHVLAGTHDTRVIEARAGTAYDAVPIYLDTRKDIAVLRVGGLPRRALFLEDDPAPRRSTGAVIGFPGGGARRISPARVRMRTEAIGRDIYSRQLTSREIYVLRASVRQGNSGGPFVDTEGRVRGMVFAASESDSDESYALTSDELEGALSKALARNRRVATGDCAI